MSRQTLIVALSGPSSSGKTTLARLLRQVFQPHLYILHLDDFYLTDKDIPTRQISSEFGDRTLADWDCAESIDLELLRNVLSHIKSNSTVPDWFSSKEDQNSVGSTSVTEQDIQGVRESLGEVPDISICILDGFLLFPDVSGGDYRAELGRVIDNVADLKMFLSSTRDRTIERRTKRTGYVTLEGFWEDPPGYVEDVVWPNYSRDHKWLFTNEAAVDAGRIDRDKAKQAQIEVAPGEGEVPMDQVLAWAAGKIKAAVSAVQIIK